MNPILKKQWKQPIFLYYCFYLILSFIFIFHIFIILFD